ncbi:MAG: hypothetical protein SAL70_21615 [Scytonema sp. PMC 1070.18]|nr:hypothetical protein [Scytonema sp. PMC 1070.18]
MQIFRQTQLKHRCLFSIAIATEIANGAHLLLNYTNLLKITSNSTEKEKSCSSQSLLATVVEFYTPIFLLSN